MATSTPAAPVAQASYSGGQATPAVGTPEYAAAQNLALRAAPAPRVDPSTVKIDFSMDPEMIERKFESKSDARATEITDYARGLYDSINQKYNSKVAGDKELIAGQDARVRVLNTRAGLNDSGTGSAAIGDVQKKGDKIIAADEAQRTAELSGALGKVDILRQNQAKVDEATAKNDLKTATDLRAKNTKDALDSLTSLANGGVDLNTLKEKEPDSYASLKKELGLTDLELSAKYNSLRKPAAQINYTYVTDKDGLTYGYGVDPLTGKLVHTEKEHLPGLQPGDTLTHTKDGSLLIKSKNGTYKPVSPPKPSSYAANQETDALNWLARQPGYNDAVDKEKFKSDPTYKAWAIQQAETEKAATKKKASTTPSNPFSIEKAPATNTA